MLQPRLTEAEQVDLSLGAMLGDPEAVKRLALESAYCAQDGTDGNGDPIIQTIETGPLGEEYFVSTIHPNGTYGYETAVFPLGRITPCFHATYGSFEKAKDALPGIIEQLKVGTLEKDPDWTDEAL